MIIRSLSILVILMGTLRVLPSRAEESESIRQRSLVVVQQSDSPSIAIAHFENLEEIKHELYLDVHVERTLRMKQEGVKDFSGIYKPIFNSQGLVSIPSFKVGHFNSFIYLRLKRGANTLVSVDIFSTKKNWFEDIRNNVSIYGRAILDSGPNWHYLDISEVSHESADTLGKAISGIPEDMQKSFAKRQTIADPEDGGRSKFLKGVCVRPFAPKVAGFLSFGMLQWEIRNPVQAGYSLKEEFDEGTGRGRLRCPTKLGDPEFYVDGLYRRSWASSALKIPNHCTAVRRRNDNYCCCHLVTSRYFGHCEMIETQPLGWPTEGLMCS